jgi:GGDN family.
MTKNVPTPSPEIIIGIVCPKELNQEMSRALEAFPNFRPVYLQTTPTSLQKEELLALIHQVEVVLFAEFPAFIRARQLAEIPIPAHYVPLTGTGLYRSLFFIANKCESLYLSIDTVDEEYMRKEFYNLGKRNYTYLSYPSHDLSYNRDDIVRFHIGNHQKYGAVAVTGVQEIAAKLANLNIPCIWVTPTHQDLIVSLERALLATEARKIKESQIVFGIINIDRFNQVTEKYNTELDVQMLKLKLQQMLLNYVKLLDGHLIHSGGDEFSFITTRGIFERETRGYKFIPLLKTVKDQLGVTLSIGVGFGTTAAEAGNHARLALRQSKEVGGNVCYIVREDQSVIGPVEVIADTQYEKYQLSITNPELIERAKKAGMSAAYMTKLMARVARHKKYDYTAHELAATLDITVRSVHRILLKWMDAGLVDIVGEEKITSRGRPSRIYRLTFLLDEKEEDGNQAGNQQHIPEITN